MLRTLRTITESGGFVWSSAFRRLLLSFLLAIQGRLKAEHYLLFEVSLPGWSSEQKTLLSPLR